MRKPSPHWHGGSNSSVSGCSFNWWYAPPKTALWGHVEALNVVEGPRSNFTVAKLRVTWTNHFAAEPGDTITVSVAGAWPPLPPSVVGKDVALSVGSWLTARGTGRKFRPLHWRPL
jgi:hypothetical protein